MRYVVPWLPLASTLLIVAADSAGRGARTAAALLLAAGLLLSVSAVSTGWLYRQWLCGVGPWTKGPVTCALEALPSNLLRVAGAAIPDEVAPQVSAERIFAANRLDVWWYAMRAGLVSSAASNAIGAALAAATVALGFRCASVWRAAADGSGA
jgi:hypothetical protein